MAVANFCSRRNRHLRTQARCRSMRTKMRRYLRVRTQDHQQSMAMASCTLLFPLAFLIIPIPLLVARTGLLPSRLPASMMAFFPLFTSSPVFLSLLPSGARALSPHARVRLNRLLLHPFLVRRARPLGRIEGNGTRPDYLLNGRARNVYRGAVIRCLALCRQVVTTARRRRCRSRANRTGNDALKTSEGLPTPPTARA